MKKLSLTWIIILAGIVSAIVMLLNAFAPAAFKALSNKTIMLVLLGLALVLAPAKKVDIKCFATLLCVTAVCALLAFLFDLAAGPAYLKAVIIAAIAGCAMILLKQEGFAFSVALVAAAASAYETGDIQKALLVAVAYAVGYACLNGKKITNPVLRVAASAIICLAFCAFR